MGTIIIPATANVNIISCASIILLGSKNATAFPFLRPKLHKALARRYILFANSSKLNLVSSKEIENNFKNEFGIGKTEILENVYRKLNANKYLASFTYFIKENIKNKQLKAIVENAFYDLITNHLLKYPDIKNNKVGFVGSIANVFSEILIERCKFYNITIQLIVAKPIMKLVEFYK